VSVNDEKDSLFKNVSCMFFNKMKKLQIKYLYIKVYIKVNKRLDGDLEFEKLF